MPKIMWYAQNSQCVLNLIFPNLSIDSNLSINSKFFSVGLQLLTSSQRDFKIFECCFSWTSQFLPIHEKMEN